jgi:predicted adenine nucleotide alpha hydrolase (AANH) superfamily ATPase
MSKILLHACCAICSAYPIKSLGDVVVYFYNPNIVGDYEQRLEAQRTLCAHFGVELIVEHDDWDDWAAGLEDEPERGKRCEKCFALRLEKTAQKARELGIEHFTTSLPISPHKDFEQIVRIGAKWAPSYLPLDFKDGFLHTNQIARELGLYRQKHCGCQASMVQLCHGRTVKKGD